MRNLHDPVDKEAEVEAAQDSESARVRKYVKNIYRLIEPVGEGCDGGPVMTPQVH